MTDIFPFAHLLQDRCMAALQSQIADPQLLLRQRAKLGVRLGVHIGSVHIDPDPGQLGKGCVQQIEYLHQRIGG
jgi:hypothetical protein